MNHNQIKGSLLEYLVRQLLYNCGFTSVKPDGHYVYQQNGTGLFFINGKGAAHDADVLMDPPIQMPFFYPTQILFECKAYKNGPGIGTMRNALGLRYDINEFEIITDKSIEARKNNKRANYAISGRKRYIYQVGVASLNDFNSSSVEFAANNKITLLSLRALLDDETCDLFNDIDKQYFLQLSDEIKNYLYTYIKNKSIRLDIIEINSRIESFISTDEVIGKIIRNFRAALKTIYVGLIESGDLIFLKQNLRVDSDTLRFNDSNHSYKARINYYMEEPNSWMLTLINQQEVEQSELVFFLPERILSIWRRDSMDKRTAIQIKESYFSRIFIFTGNIENSNKLPFIVINIDKDWIDVIRRRYRDEEEDEI